MKILDVSRNQNTYMKKARRNVLWPWHTMEIYWFKSDELYAVPGHLLLNKFNVREQVKEAWNSEAVYIRFSAGCYKWREMFILKKNNERCKTGCSKKYNRWQTVMQNVKIKLRKWYGSQNIFVNKQFFVLFCFLRIHSKSFIFLE